MARQKLPIKTPIYQNIDEMALSQFSPALIDGYMDEEGNTHRRPGLSLLVDLGTGAKVDGLYWWKKQGYAIAVSGGKVFKITASDGTNTDITGAGAMVTGTRVSFTEDATYAFMANGGKIQHYNNAGTATQMVDADCPTAVTQLGWHDQYLLCNNVGTGQMHYSDLNNSISWSALSFVNAESMPDNILSINTAWREILLLGESSAEIFWDDGTNPFSRLEGAYTERGCSAAYSTAFFDNTWQWLDHTRRFVRIDGRVPQVISTPFDKTIQGLSTISDAMSDILEVDGRTFWIISFPTDEKTYVYDYALKLWYEWSYWDTVGAVYQRWLGNCVCYAKGWNKHLVGSRIDGKIYTASTSVYTDNGNTIRTLRRTAHVDYDTMARKRSNALYSRVKRGTGISTASEVTGTDATIYTCKISHTAAALNRPITGADYATYWVAGGATGGAWVSGTDYTGQTPYIIVRWNDDGKDSWSNDHQINFGRVGDKKIVDSSLKRLGIYQTRQWEFILTDPVPLVLADAEEDVELLDGD